MKYLILKREQDNELKLVNITNTMVDANIFLQELEEDNPPFAMGTYYVVEAREHTIGLS